MKIFENVRWRHLSKLLVRRQVFFQSYTSLFAKTKCSNRTQPIIHFLYRPLNFKWHKQEPTCRTLQSHRVIKIKGVIAYKESQVAGSLYTSAVIQVKAIAGNPVVVVYDICNHCNRYCPRHDFSIQFAVPTCWQCLDMENISPSLSNIQQMQCNMFMNDDYIYLLVKLSLL